MALLQTFLSELLVEHECVIVPGLGGFVTNNRPSTLNKRTNKLMPPAKEVGFNQRLTHNDGVLTQWLRIHEHISYEEASAKITAEVEAISAELKAGNQYQFDAVGVIYLNSEGNVQFIPSQERNYLSSSFGLAPLTLIPLRAKEEKKEEAIAIPLVVTETRVEQISTGTRRSWRNLAAAAVFPFLIASGYLVQTGMNNPETFSAVPFSFSNTPISSSYQPRFVEEKIAFPAPKTGNPLKTHLASNPQSDSFYYSFEEERISPDGIQIILNSSADLTSALPTKDVSKSASSLKLYFIVGGAFKEASNAKDYVTKLNSKGFDASIFGQSGDLHLVSLGSYTSKSAAKKALASVRETENENAWLKRQ
ncbi:MAG: hypothetical protein ACI898_001504 [Flavobacteriales bacterium]|jgi:hypothetical protein